MGSRVAEFLCSDWFSSAPTRQERHVQLASRRGWARGLRPGPNSWFDQANLTVTKPYQIEVDAVVADAVAAAMSCVSIDNTTDPEADAVKVTRWAVD